MKPIQHSTNSPFKEVDALIRDDFFDDSSDSDFEKDTTKKNDNFMDDFDDDWDADLDSTPTFANKQKSKPKMQTITPDQFKSSSMPLPGKSDDDDDDDFDDLNWDEDLDDNLSTPVHSKPAIQTITPEQYQKILKTSLQLPNDTLDNSSDDFDEFDDINWDADLDDNETKPKTTIAPKVPKLSLSKLDFGDMSEDLDIEEAKNVLPTPRMSLTEISQELQIRQFHNAVSFLFFFYYLFN